jgi:hypothetical protein
MFNMSNNMNNQNMQNNPNFKNMQNMLAMYNNMRMNQVFNPNKVDKSSKRTLINMNLNQSRAGFFKNFAKCDSLSIPYSPCDPGKTNAICTVKVIYEHALDVAEQYAEIGAQTFTKENKLNPVVVNIVGRDFTGDNYESSEEMRDEMMNIRTTFCSNPVKTGIFPVREQHCVHTPYVNVIRPKNPGSLLPWNMCYRVGFITVSPIPQGGVIRKMSSSDFVKTCTIVENIFQIAIGLGHKVLILTPFGHEEDNNPIDDIIQIYNFCIMKYGHKLNSIIIAIPQYYPKELHAKYLHEIIKPNEIVQEIDNKYDGLVVQKKIQETLTKKSEDSGTQIEDSEEENDEMQNKYQMFMQMMKSNPKMMEKFMRR